MIRTGRMIYDLIRELLVTEPLEMASVTDALLGRGDWIEYAMRLPRAWLILVSILRDAGWTNDVDEFNCSVNNDETALGEIQKLVDMKFLKRYCGNSDAEVGLGGPVTQSPIAMVTKMKDGVTKR
eukprot:3321095-Amphidinium_carterae.1